MKTEPGTHLGLVTSDVMTRVIELKERQNLANGLKTYYIDRLYCPQNVLIQFRYENNI